MPEASGRSGRRGTAGDGVLVVVDEVGGCEDEDLAHEDFVRVGPRP
jgi:hypothetical protein